MIHHEPSKTSSRLQSHQLWVQHGQTASFLHLPLSSCVVGSLLSSESQCAETLLAVYAWQGNACLTRWFLPLQTPVPVVPAVFQGAH